VGIFYLLRFMVYSTMYILKSKVFTPVLKMVSHVHERFMAILSSPLLLFSFILYH